MQVWRPVTLIAIMALSYAKPLYVNRCVDFTPTYVYILIFQHAILEVSGVNQIRRSGKMAIVRQLSLAILRTRRIPSLYICYLCKPLPLRFSPLQKSGSVRILATYAIKNNRGNTQSHSVPIVASTIDHRNRLSAFFAPTGGITVGKERHGVCFPNNCPMWSCSHRFSQRTFMPCLPGLASYGRYLLVDLLMFINWLSKGIPWDIPSSAPWCASSRQNWNSHR